MQDLIGDSFFEEFKHNTGCVLDYCVLKSDLEYKAEESHKEAAIFAMQKWQKDWKEKYDFDISFDASKMKAHVIDSKEFFEVVSKDDDRYKCSYQYLFLNPPHGSSLTIEDFNHINNMLFPNGYDCLEIYDWSTDWSDYFEDGLEWWGARCVSIYDKSLNRFIVIGASATD